MFMSNLLDPRPLSAGMLIPQHTRDESLIQAGRAVSRVAGEGPRSGRPEVDPLSGELLRDHALKRPVAIKMTKRPNKQGDRRISAVRAVAVLPPLGGHRAA
ncbi:MAG TPA: hypothetical protein VII63_12020 [Caulobacteraceae bacterium]